MTIPPDTAHDQFIVTGVTGIAGGQNEKNTLITKKHTETLFLLQLRPLRVTDTPRYIFLAQHIVSAMSTLTLFPLLFVSFLL